MGGVRILHDKLVSTRDELQAICMVELLGDVLAASAGAARGADGGQADEAPGVVASGARSTAQGRRRREVGRAARGLTGNDV